MKNQKGITLIALIITIIVMMILVAVSVSIALNNGLFNAAQDATKKTKNELDHENTLANGGVIVDGKEWPSMDAYIQHLKEQTVEKNMIKFNLNGREIEIEEGTTWGEATIALCKVRGYITDEDYIEYSSSDWITGCTNPSCSATGYYEGSDKDYLYGVDDDERIVGTMESRISGHAGVCQCGQILRRQTYAFRMDTLFT